ncbi:probable glutamate receptor [Cherax quadricarinatus]|uniref:probable glutamate receptor n=1 Tax=Cherax quadricarinatus TaxID=27406 RepID=UPI00387ED4D8
MKVGGDWSILVVFFVLRAEGSTNGFLQSPEGQRFFSAYVRAFEIRRVNVFRPSGTVGGDAEPVGVLRVLWAGLPLTLSLQRVHSGREVSVSLEASDSTALNVVFLHTPEDLSLFLEITQEALVRHYTWLVLGDIRLVTQAGPSPRLPLDNLVTFASLNTTITNVTNVIQIDLFEMYTVHDDLPYVTHMLGSWQGQDELDLPKEDWSDRRTNLTGLHLRCVTLPQEPFTYVSEPDDQLKVDIVRGYAKDVWDTLQEILGFTYTCRKPVDGTFGSMSQDGAWNGLVREVVKGRADVVVTSLDHTEARARALDFITGLREVGYRLVVRRPGVAEQTWRSFTGEFLPDAWMGTMAFVLLVPPCLALCSYFSPVETEKVNLKDAYTLAIGAFAVQGSWLEVRSTSSRIVFATIFFATLLVYAHYTSALVSILTVSSTVTDLSSLQSLLADGTFQLGFEAGTFLEVEFKNSKQWLFREVWNKLVAPDPSNLVHSDNEGIKKVLLLTFFSFFPYLPHLEIFRMMIESCTITKRIFIAFNQHLLNSNCFVLQVMKEKFVFMMEENQFASLLGNKCDVVLTKGRYFSTETGFAFSLDSPLKKVFDVKMLRMRDAGILSRLWQKWQPPTALCVDPGAIALNINHLLTAFLLLLLGVVLSAMLLPCERLYWNLIGKTKAQRNKIVLAPTISRAETRANISRLSQGVANRNVGQATIVQQLRQPVIRRGFLY